MVGEYWAGWFDHWGERHHTSDVDNDAAFVDWLLTRDISFNLYMFEGGTSFGYLAGANYDSKTPYQADTTSYDYNAPLDEAGRVTPKFHALRAVIAKHLLPGETLPEIPPSPQTLAIPRFELTQSVRMRDALTALGKPIESEYPLSMEDLGQDFGYVLYRHRVVADTSGMLDIGEARDYAIALVDGTVRATLYRGANEHAVSSLALRGGQTLDLLIENMGRIGFGAKLVDERKGLTQGVTLGGQELARWQMYTFSSADLSRLKFHSGSAPDAPAFWHGRFDLAQAGDTFIDLRGWGKGQVWVNGHHLGRFWKIGPQQSLYLPAAWLRAGRNEIVVLDTQAGATHSVQGLRDPVFATPK